MPEVDNHRSELVQRMMLGVSARGEEPHTVQMNRGRGSDPNGQAHLHRIDEMVDRERTTHHPILVRVLRHPSKWKMPVVFLVVARRGPFATEC